MKKLLLPIIFTCFFQPVSSQEKPKESNGFDIEAFKKAAQQAADREKANGQQNGTKKYVPRSQRDDGSSLKEVYARLTDAEKALTKNLPAPPENIRTAQQAAEFEDKLKGRDIRKMIIENQTASINFKMYLVNYQSVHQKMALIVDKAAKAEATFKKENPNINFGQNTSKTYMCKTDVIYLPLGDASFADEVVSANYGKGDIRFPEKNCLGTPDYEEFANVRDNKGIYNLGLGGSLVVKFTDNALVDVNGTDLYVFEMGAVEPTLLEISTNGTNWLNVGQISGGVAEVDISKVAAPNEYYYYVRLTDLKSSSTVPGADVDAVAAIGAALKLSLNAEVLFDFGKSDLKPEGIAAIKNLANQLKDIEKATINIVGYTDDVGGDETNKKLSLLRAESVSKILQAELTSRKTFVYKEKGLGKQNPVAPNTNEENRRKNRRVELLVSAF